MTWRAITEDDLLLKLNSMELEQFRALMLDVDQSDPIPDYLLDAAREAASYAAAGGYELGPDGTAPDELIKHCCARVAVEVIGRLAEPEAWRQKASDEALARFREVQKGTFQLSEPLTNQMQPDPAKHSAVRFRPRYPKANHSNMDGM